MNSTQHIFVPANGLNRLMKWPLLCGWLSLALTPLAPAADALYYNDAVISYPGTVSAPPVIDATNFVNVNTFIINFTALSVTQPFYETSDTLNYTNTGVMVANTGFQFDNRGSGSTGTRTPSANFFNSGSISCGSTNDAGALDGVITFFGFGAFGECLVNATNIVNPGTVTAGVDGMIQMSGENVNLNHGTLNMEGTTATGGGSGVFGLNTNFWDPSELLGPTNADSAFFPIAPFDLVLTNSTAYMDQRTVGSSIVTRAVFLQDTSGPGITNNVYFNTAGGGTGPGSVTIEWSGSFLNPANGVTLGNFLYLNCDYILGSSTNVALINGIPDNFRFTGSPIQLTNGTPATAGFVNVFPAGSISNAYAFANAQLISTTVATNEIPNHAITNLPGRIEISADRELNLAFAHITGPNYLSVQSPHQFDGSPGALIQSPYSDINLGVTNGFLTVSNLLSPYVPNWSGNVQAWSTRWLVVDAGVTNDYRVLIVGSQLNPVTLAQVQDMILHATNSLVISDAMNIMRTFNADARNLTLTTNSAGNGATSLEGELNVSSSGVFWASSLPNVRNLTNNGAIRMQNLTQFIGSSNNVTVTPSTPAVAATGTLAEVPGRSNVKAGNLVQVGTNAYYFASKLTNSLVNRVLIAATFDGSMNNLIAAINRTAGAGTVYSSSTVTNPQIAAGALTNHAFMITARTAGSDGNSIYLALSTPTTNVTWNASYLSGGVDATPAITNVSPTVYVPYDNFINGGLLSDNGSSIWANNFASSGTVSNQLGSFNLNSLTTTLTNGLIAADGDIVITADSLVASNVTLQAGRSLSLTVTNLLTDTGVTNGNIWTVQSTNGTGGNGLIMPIKPALGDLLGTTITNNISGPNMQSINVWAGEDRGASVNGYTNNEAVGRLILDAFGTGSRYVFSGASTSNALYVDYLELRDSATNFDGTGNLSALTINPNLVIYYAQAVLNGVSVAEKLDHSSGDRLRWVPAYAGYFSSTNLVYPPGVTNVVNIALSQFSQIDSDGDGVVNSGDATPFFVQSQVNFAAVVTNVPPLSVRVQWATIPNATNFIYYSTNLASGTWLPFTNFGSYYFGNNQAVANVAQSNNFISPQPYYSPATNVWIFDTITNTPHYYRVLVQPWLTYPF